MLNLTPATVGLLAMTAAQEVSFDLVALLERFGLPTTMLILAGIAIFVKRWVVPAWVLEEQRRQFEKELERETKRADRMEKALLEALMAGRVFAEAASGRGSGA